MCSNHTHHSHEHNHVHSHDHHSHDHPDYEKHNREWYDSNATKHINNRFMQEVSDRIAQALIKEYPFAKESTVVLDYACGPGQITLTLEPHVKQVIGVDISQGSVDAFNERSAKAGIPPEKMQALRIDSNAILDAFKGQTFEVVMVNMAYHHFDSVQDITNTLVSLLRPGGTLLISDLSGPISKMEQDADLEHVVAHKHGFSEQTIRSLFETAGLSEISYNPCIHAEEGDIIMDIFIAKGTKQSK